MLQVVPYKGQPKKMRVFYKFTTKQVPACKSVHIKGASQLPADMEDRLFKGYQQHFGGERLVGMNAVSYMQKLINDQYLKDGWDWSQFLGMTGLETGDWQVQVVEPKVKSVTVKIDKAGKKRQGSGQVRTHVTALAMPMAWLGCPSVQH